MSFTNNDIHNAAGPGSSAEPSMEEILASIRRILKEDEPGKPAEPATAPVDMDDDVLLLDASMIARPADVSTATILPVEPAPAAEHPAAKLQATAEPLHFSSEPTPFAREYEPISRAMPEPVLELPPIIEAEPEPPILSPPAPPPQPETYRPAPPAPEPSPTEPTMNDSPNHDSFEPPHSLISDQTTDAAASSIGALVRSMTTEKSIAITKHSPVTIEDIVREEIRPLLKSWLDSHLPSLVERIVRSEIERVINRSVV